MGPDGPMGDWQHPHIFTLLQLGKLPSPQDVPHYMGYMIKTMKLSGRFTWAIAREMCAAAT